MYHPSPLATRLQQDLGQSIRANREAIATSVAWRVLGVRAASEQFQRSRISIARSDTGTGHMQQVLECAPAHAPSGPAGLLTCNIDLRKVPWSIRSYDSLE